MAYKPLMRVIEYEGYRSVYCGVCQSIKRNFGELPRFTLSYDVVLLALMDMSVNGIKHTAEMQRCIAHPLTKRSIATCNEGLDYSAYASMILLYHKLGDDRQDSHGVRHFASSAAIPLISGAYIKARSRYPRLASRVEKQMREQSRLEKEQCPDLDLACQPTARIMQAVFSELSDDKAQSRRLGSFGYFLGRYVYLTDALDDLRSDAAKGSYNPLLAREGLKSITDEDYRRIAESVGFSVAMSLGLLADSYCKLGITLYRSIIDNIIYLGLNEVFRQVKEESFHKRIKERNEQL